jgi:hypothetical protein
MTMWDVNFKKKKRTRGRNAEDFIAASLLKSHKDCNGHIGSCWVFFVFERLDW